jgi:hypothetical protein
MDQDSECAARRRLNDSGSLRRTPSTTVHPITRGSPTLPRPKNRHNVYAGISSRIYLTTNF